MGEVYPGTFVLGEETAPNKAASHSALRASTVESGSAVPVDLKVPQPAERGRKENFSEGDCRASRTCRPEVRTSLPMPSPGMSPMRRLRTAADIVYAGGGEVMAVMGGSLTLGRGWRARSSPTQAVTRVITRDVRQGHK